MLFKMFLRGFSSKNLGPNRIAFFTVNWLNYQNVFFFRNVHATPKVVLASGNDGNLGKFLETPAFKDYIVKNNNFKNSALEISNLNFSVDDKHESLKLLFQLKESSGNDSLWQETLDCLKRELNTFEMEDLLKAIALALNLELKKSRFFEDFVTSLDKELLSRKFSFDDILEVLFVLRHTYTGRKSLKYFHFYLRVFRTYRKLQKFQPHQAIHIFYHFEEFSETNKQLYKYAVLKYVKENLSLFNADGVGVILAALTRAKLFGIDINLIKQITCKMINEIENVNSLHLFCLSKFLLGCSVISHSTVILDFQQNLIPHISKFNASSVIFSLYTGYPHTLNLSLWNSVVERLKTELKSLDMVNICRLMRITTTFKVNDKEFLKFALEAVEEMQNVGAYNRHIISFCKDLVTHQIYSKKLLDIIFSNDFIDKMLSRSFAKDLVEWTFIYFTLQIDKPDYQYNCLNKELEKKIKKKFFNFKPFGKPVLTPLKSKIKLLNILKKAYGEDAVTESYCIIHFERGVVLRFDENFNALPIPEEYKNNTKRVNKTPLDEHIWICLNIYYSLLKELTPTQETYARHLRATGYKPVLVHYPEFHHFLSLGTEETIKYLKNEIEAGLNEVLQEKQTKLKFQD